MAPSGSAFFSADFSKLMQLLDLKEDTLLRELANTITNSAGARPKDPMGLVKRSLSQFQEALSKHNNLSSGLKHPHYSSTHLTLMVPFTQDLRRAQVMPYLQDIMLLARSRHRNSPHHQKFIRFERSVTYLLHRDLYLAGLYDPYNGYSLLAYPLDWIYFPDIFTESARKLRHRFWRLLCRNGNKALFTHTGVRLDRIDLSELHSSIWTDVCINYAKICIDFGDYSQALLFSNRLSSMSSASPDFSENKALFHEVSRLRFHASSHLQLHSPFEVMFAEFLRCKRALLQFASKESFFDEMLLKLNRALLRVSVRYFLKGQLPPIHIRHYLSTIIEDQVALMGRLPAFIGGFDYDTIARAYAVINNNYLAAKENLSTARSILAIEAKAENDELASIARSWILDEDTARSLPFSHKLGSVRQSEFDEFMASGFANADYLRQYWTASTNIMVCIAEAKAAPHLAERKELLGHARELLQSFGELLDEADMGHAREMYLLLLNYLNCVNIAPPAESL